VVPVAMESADVIHVCDFCLALHPPLIFPLREHASTSLFDPDINAYVTAEDTDAWWAACRVCADLVVAQDHRTLRDRALAVLKARCAPGLPSAWETESVLLQLAAFWKAGPASPVSLLV
jgi:hypothetical protein